MNNTKREAQAKGGAAFSLVSRTGAMVHACVAMRAALLAGSRPGKGTELDNYRVMR